MLQRSPLQLYPIIIAWCFSTLSTITGSSLSNRRGPSGN